MAVRYDLLPRERERKSRPVEKPPTKVLRDSVRFPVAPARVAHRAEDRLGLLHREGLNSIPPNAVQLRHGMPEVRRFQQVKVVSELDNRTDAQEVRPPCRRLDVEPPRR